jgi:broad specificity phosphatase PhoE
VTILLARHGETDDNIEPIRIQGSRDTPLNDAGRAQAAELAERMRDEQIQTVYSSHLSRARETAEIVVRRLGLDDPVIDERLAEGDRGELEGLYWQDIARDDPELYAAWRRAGEGFRFPGGESLREQTDRTLAALADVRAGSLPALVVGHGGTLRVVLCDWDSRGLNAFHEWDVPNVAVVRL